MFYPFLTSPLRVSYPSDLIILQFITLRTFNEGYTLRSSSYGIFSIPLLLPLSHNQVSHPYTMTGKITIFMF